MSGYVQLPTATGPAPAPATAPAAGGGLKLGNRNLVMVLGLAAAVIVGLISARKQPAASSPSLEIDTTETDLYNDLQPELEGISDRLDALEKPPTPATPTPTPPRTVPPSPKPPAPVPSRKPPTTPARTSVRYIVKPGDTITSIARAYKASPTNVYKLNEAYIAKNAAAHKKRTHGTSTTIYPGMVLTVPWGQPGQRG